MNTSNGLFDKINENEIMISYIDEFYGILEIQSLSEAFLEKNIRQLEITQDEDLWDLLCEYQQLTIKFMEANTDKINWTIISRTQQLTNDFINKYWHLLDEELINKYQTCYSG